MLTHLPGFQLSLRVLEGLKDSSVKAYSAKIKEFHVWLEGNDILVDPAALTHKDIEKYLEWCFYQGNSNQTRYTKLTALAKFFRYLKYEEIISEDITTNIPRPVLRKKLMLTFTRDEVLRFFRQCDITKEKGLRDVCILILAVFCGLRMNEIITTDLNDIIDNGKDIDINIQGKKDHDRQVYLWKSPGLFIRQYLMIRISHGARGSDPFLVSYSKSKSKGRRLTAASIDQLIKQLAEKAGIRKAEIHAHMFRATHANDLQHIKGYRLPAIQERLGWKDLSTAGRYLVRRERIHKEYNSLYEYWKGFNSLWKEIKTDGNDNGDVPHMRDVSEGVGVA